MNKNHQLLAQFQGIDRSMDSLRQAIVTLSGQNLELLSIIANLQRQQQMKTVDPGLEDLPVYLPFYARNNRGMNAL